MSKIMLSHGGGGKASSRLIKEVIQSEFSNEILDELLDSARMNISSERDICFTTDSYVVKPIFFPGGDIGELAINGTINDLSVMGAKPLYISCSFILEEGLDMKVFKEIVQSAGKAARNNGVKIVTGDTKVIERGSADKIFINTAGIGTVDKKINLNPKLIEPGDKILINGPVGNHGFAVMSEREGFDTNIKSDCTSLWSLIEKFVGINGIKFMRDPTRGGLATVLKELAESSKLGIRIREKDIPIDENVSGFSEILGIDPLYVANEGKVVVVTSEKSARLILEKMKNNSGDSRAGIIGNVTEKHRGKLILETEIGGERILDKLIGEQLPRIC